MSDPEDQASNQDDQTDDQQDQPQADNQQQSDKPGEPLTADEIAALRKRTEIAESQAKDARKDAAKYRTTARDLQQAEDDRKTKTATEQGDFKALHEAAQTTIKARDARIVELEGQISTAEHVSLRVRVAQKYKLPADLTDLIQGDDEAALDASAKVLAKHVRTDAPDTEAGRGGRRQINEQKPVVPGKTIDGVQKVAWTAGT